MMPVQWASRVWRWPLGLVAGLCVTVLPQQAALAAANDDRPVLYSYVSSGVIGNRRVQDDLSRAPWSPQELRAALARAYGIRTVALSQFLASPAGATLLRRQGLNWSTDLAPEVRLAALRAALLADSRDGSISLLGVLQRLPVRFELATVPALQAPAPAAACGCNDSCGGSVRAQLAFLVACLQAGSTEAPGR